MRIVKDIELDDTELHCRMEEIIKEIDEKNSKMAQEIYDAVMERRKSKKDNNN